MSHVFNKIVCFKLVFVWVQKSNANSVFILLNVHFTFHLHELPTLAFSITCGSSYLSFFEQHLIYFRGEE